MAIDLTQIPVQKTGIGIHAMHMIREIIKMNRNTETDRFYFFAQDDDAQWQQEITGQHNCFLIPIKSKFFRKLPLRFYFEQFLLPKQCKKLKIDVLLSLHYTMPLFTSIPVVVIFPDMTFYLFPHLHKFIKRLYFKTFIPLSIKKSRHIITVSESTKHDIMRLFSSKTGEKITAIHLGVASPPLKTDAEIKTDLDELGLKSKEYFLYVGTLEPRKNIPAIIDGFRAWLNTGSCAEKQFKLVIAGGKGWFYEEIFQKVSAYNLKDQVIFTGYINERVKQSLLAHAYLFVYPSFYEGFGLPILEAMRYGVPVITGNVSSLPEVAGEAALLVNPNNSHDIAEAMQQLLENHRLYNELSEKSRIRAESFTWHQNALQTVTLLKKVAHES